MSTATMLVEDASSARRATQLLQSGVDPPGVSGLIFETRRGRAHRLHCGCCFDCCWCSLCFSRSCVAVLCSRDEYWPEACARVAANCFICSCIEELEDGDNDSGDQMVLKIEHDLANTHCISSIVFNRCGLTNVGAQALARALRRNASLQEFDISQGNKRIDAEGHRILSIALRESRAPLVTVRGVRGWPGKDHDVEHPAPETLDIGRSQP